MKQQPQRNFLFVQVAFPILIAVGLSLALYLTIRWSSRQSDIVSSARQEQLVDLVVSRLQARIAHDQESSTVWDDAVKAVRVADKGWLDMNLGEWMHTYFRHDGAFVLNPKREVIYAFLAGVTDTKLAYDLVEPSFELLVRKIQNRLEAGDTTGIDDQVLSIGESDFTMIGGHPAIVSVKPIVSDTGEIKLTAGQEFLHVAIRYLDGDFLHELADDYQFGDLRFSKVKVQEDARSYAELKAASGATIGYFTWKPFEPGSAVMQATTPVLAAAAFALLITMAMLGAIIWRRSVHLKASQAQLAHLAHNDTLTGLPNRASFAGRLAEIVAASDKSQTTAVLYLDLDRFKQVNDTLGHPVGDQLLIQVAARLRDVAGADTIVARLGGDEFTSAISNTSQEDVERLCNRLITAIRQPFAINGQPILIGLSIGVALGHSNEVEAGELTRKADIALYHAKGAGRNRFAIFGTHMDDLVRSKRDLERDLRDAIESKDQIEVHYQPVISAFDRAVKGVEALARWRHPYKGIVPPDMFIPVAKETHLIEALGEKVLREACAAALKWGSLEVAVNASAIELRSETYAMRVVSILSQLGFDPARLEIEITETALADNSGHCEKNISALRAIGVRFALDDFGTGFSSFGRLQKLDVDRIKIDKCFVAGFGKPGGSEDIVKAMIGIAHAKGLSTTAEGIETPEQNDILRKLGCDDLQGYLFSKPLPKSQIDKMFGSPEWGRNIAK
jgi:diguanylate cyclase (GGDEF)-like protein